MKWSKKHCVFSQKLFLDVQSNTGYHVFKLNKNSYTVVWDRALSDLMMCSTGDCSVCIHVHFVHVRHSVHLLISSVHSVMPPAETFWLFWNGRMYCTGSLKIHIDNRIGRRLKEESHGPGEWVCVSAYRGCLSNPSKYTHLLLIPVAVFKSSALKDSLPDYLLTLFSARPLSAVLVER